MSGALLDRQGMDWVGLPEAAAVLGVHRATVNDMVREGRLAAERDGARWVVKREDLDEFAASYVRPPNAPPQRIRGGLLATSRSVLEWLVELEEATAVELAQVVDLHEGNVRKHLRILEAKGMVARLPDGCWVVSAQGHQTVAMGAGGGEG